MNYRISTVAEMTGIPRNTLIAWERRYGLIQPPRQPNGYRYYSEEDVTELLRVKNALNAGLKISEAVQLLKQRRAPPQEPGDLENSGEANGHDTQVRTRCAQARETLFQRLVGYRGEEAHALLDELRVLPFSLRLHEVIFPVLRRVGDGWERGELSVAQEHYASGIVRAHLASLMVNQVRHSLNAPHIACTTMHFDEHELGALALSIQLSQEGFRVSYLGSKLPLSDLVGFCERQNPRWVCISCITPPTAEELFQYLDGVRGVAQRGTEVVFGGSCLRDVAVEVPEGVRLVPDWSEFQPTVD